MNSLFRPVFRFFLYSIIILLLFSCDEKDPAPYVPTLYTLEIPKYFPTNLNIPADNPLTEEGIRLGRYLFYDGRLSGRTVFDSLMSCGSCHIQANSFEPGINNTVFHGGRTFGLNGAPTPHVVLPLINLVWNPNGYLWNGLIRKDNPDVNRRRL